MTPLSEHFTLEELTFSQVATRLGIDNTPPAAALENLPRLCALLLEPARTILAVPLHVDSGFRCPELNARIGGSPASAHMFGRAADVIPIGLDLAAAFETLRLTADLPYDQIIFECAAWIHLAVAPEGAEPRREALTATGGPGTWRYARVGVASAGAVA